MSNKFCILLLVFSFLCVGLADIPIPKCLAGNIDPGTGLTCGKNDKGQDIVPYGYDDTWEVKTEQDNTKGTKWISVNGKWPPPPVVVDVYQRIRIKLVNSLSNNEAVTLHFHGILQNNGYVTMDGPQGLTQSPIMPGQNFTYDFPVNKAGTFWIHSHATGQYPKGLRSPLVVKDPADATKYGYAADLDYTVTVSDWWPNFWTTLDQYNPAPPAVGVCGVGIEIPPQKIIVNDNAPEWGHPRTDGQLSYLVPPNMKARFRFINLSAFARYYIHLDTYQEDITIIEVDGVIIKPVLSKGIELASGQRVSVVIKGLDGSVVASRKIIIVSDPRVSSNKGTNSACKLQTNKPSGATYDSYTQYAWAYIDNVGDTIASRQPPTTEDLNNGNDMNIWLDEDMYGRPYFSSRPKLEFAIQKRNEEVSIPGRTEKVKVWIPENTWKFNETAFVPDDNEGPWFIKSTEVNGNFIHPILLNDKDGYGTMSLRSPSQPNSDVAFPQPETAQNSQQASGALDRTTTLMRAIRSVNGDVSKKYLSAATYGDIYHTVVLPTAGDVHWFVLRSKRGDHPIHMHGHEFQLLAKLPVLTDPNTRNPYDFDFGTINGKNFYQRIFDKVTFDRPVNQGVSRRDTVMAEKGWDYVIAIKADNPGVWAIHCHNDFHADTGMFMQIVEVPTKLRQQLGVWDVGEQNKPSCGLCYQPWISKSGSISKKYTSDYTSRPADIWGPVAQTVRTSMQYYGCPQECYDYQFSVISV